MTTTDTRLPLSLEFFPPKTPEGVAKLAAARRELYALAPMHEKCGAACTPSARMARTACIVPSCVEPPAP